MSTRRHLFKTVFAGAASLPFMTLSRSLAANQGGNSQGQNGQGNGNAFGQNAQSNQNGAQGNGNAYGLGNGGGRTAAGCLLSGTRIAIPDGESAVEDLKIGDEVITLSGPKPIKWIGRDQFTKAEHRPWHHSVMPVCFIRGALNGSAPTRELYLSPLHCVFIDDVLIRAKHLVNGTSIIRAAPADAFALEYFHLDLGTHEVILAHDAPVESFLDLESREAFANFVQYERLYGAEPAKMRPFAPILDYRSRTERMTGAVRDVVSNVIDVRDRIQRTRDRLASRALLV